jgi:hypothetical protein
VIFGDNITTTLLLAIVQAWALPLSVDKSCLLQLPPGHKLLLSGLSDHIYLRKVTISHLKPHSISREPL